MNEETAYSSNSVRLSPGEWAIVLPAFLIAVFALFPCLWRSLEDVPVGPDFRLAQDLRDDYWLYRGCTEIACRRCPVVFLGDSVIWGAYVDNDNTLPAHLNRALGEDRIANLAVDGLHNVAMEGLMRCYGGAIKGKRVMLHFNPLWMTSRRYDLRGGQEPRIHHPRLIPQFFPRIASYREGFLTRVGIVLERHIAFLRLQHHLRLCFLDNNDVASWVLEHPRGNPFERFSLSIDAAEREKQNDDRSWQARRIRKHDWEWMGFEESLQWASFERTVDKLDASGNEILLVIGPFNPYTMTDESLERFRRVQRQVTEWAEKKEIPYFLVPDLPSRMYADASHPLAEGYALIAEEMLADPKCREWMGQ